MGFAEWVAVAFASGFAFGTLAVRVGLWCWLVDRWNEESPDPLADEFIPIPMKFRRLPPGR